MMPIATLIKNYLRMYPVESTSLNHLQKQLKNGEDIFSKENMNGHITASTFVLNSSNQVLTIFHKKLQKYLQLGGHMDQGENSITTAARREVLEEVNIDDLVLDKWHTVNKAPNIMYIFHTNAVNISVNQLEVDHVKWVSLEEARLQPDWFITKTFERAFVEGII